MGSFLPVKAYNTTWLNIFSPRGFRSTYTLGIPGHDPFVVIDAKHVIAFATTAAVFVLVAHRALVRAVFGLKKAQNYPS